MVVMSNATSPSSSRPDVPDEPFAGADRVVFEQAEAFSAAPDFVMPPLRDVSPEVSSGIPEHTRVETEYYDTIDLALASAGITLRHDLKADEWTVVLPTASGDDGPIRREAHYPGSPEAVPDEVRRLLQVRLRGQSVAPAARVVTRRVTTPLISRSGARIADVVDEHVFAFRRDGREAQFREVDVEISDLDGVGHRLLQDVNEVLLRAGCRLEPPAAEMVRAFGPAPRDSVSWP
jgi:hypothetical protein